MRDSAGKKRLRRSGAAMLCMVFLSLLFLPTCARAEEKQLIAGNRISCFLFEVFQQKDEGMKAGAPAVPIKQMGRLASLLYRHPLEFILIMGGALLLIVVVLLILFRNRAHSAAAMEKLLYTDALTGYPNYKAFARDGHRLVKHHPDAYAVVYMDMHQFKAINDTLGYAAGDRLLISLSKLIDEFVQNGELFARIYADKFVLLLRFNDQETFARRLEKLSKKLESLSSGEFEMANFLFSAGVFHLQAGDTDLGIASDRANYAKDTVREHFVNTFVFYDDVMRRQVLSEKALESSMQSALERGEFEPFYQPKINVITGELVGAEALVRWRHPEKGLLPPGSFVPFYEKNGFIVKIDFAIFEAVCKQLRDWGGRGIDVVPVSVNFSRKHMLDRQFAEKLRVIADRYEVAPQLLEVEITETIELESMDIAVEFARSLKANGFAVSIDDYGTGYSSIAFLQKLPLDVLKLDKAFLGNAMETQKARDIMRHVVSAVKANGIRVLCEGIETADQRDFVLDLNCQFVQGYLYSKPLPVSEFEQYLLQAKIADHGAMDYVSLSHFEEQAWSNSSDFLSRVMPGWIMGCYTTPGYPIFYISQHLLASLGYSEAEFFCATQGQFVNCLHPDDREEIARQLQENQSNTEEYLLQYRLLKKDGGSIWIRDIGKKVLSEDGQEAILCVCTDISDIMALQQKRDDLLSAIPGGVSELLLLPEGPKILSATDLFYEIIGHSEEQMQSLDNSLFAIAYEPDLPETKQNLQSACAAGSASCECSLRIRYGDGSLHWLALRGTMHHTERGVVATAIVTNIDEQIKSREEAQIVRTKMELALTLTEHAVFEYDLKTKTIYEQSGLGQYGIISSGVSDVPESLISEGYVHPKDVSGVREMYRKIHAGQTHASCEMRMRSALNAEEYIWTRTVLSTIYGEDGAPVKAVGIVDNIDHEKQMEHAVAQEEQYRKALMASSILAYDVNLNLNQVERITGASSQRLKLIQSKLPDPHCYTALIGSAVMSMLIEEDRERFLREMEPAALLELFWGSVREKEYEYRRLLADGRILWVSAFLHMVQDELSGDILCFVYYRDIQARKNAEESLKYHATRDPLTGLLNRASGEQQIKAFLAAQSDGAACHAFFMFDVDNFKKVNDTYGHQQGDEFLFHVGEVIRENLRDSDIVVRIGGDEFVALVKNLPDGEAACSIAEKICSAVQQHQELKRREFAAAVSIGIALAPTHGKSFQTLYHCADQAMYVAKNRVDRRVAMFDPRAKQSPGATKY